MIRLMIRLMICQISYLNDCLAPQILMRQNRTGFILGNFLEKFV